QKLGVVYLYVPDHIGKVEAMYEFDYGNGDKLLTSERNISYSWNTTGTYTVKLTAFNDISRWTTFITIMIQDNITGLAFVNSSATEMRNPTYNVAPTSINQAATILWKTATGTDINVNLTIGDTPIHLDPGQDIYLESLSYNSKTLTNVYAINNGFGRSKISMSNAVFTCSSGTYSLDSGWMSATSAQYENIKVDLKAHYTILGIVVRGSDNKWVTSFDIKFSGQDFIHTVIPRHELFEGNEDAVTPVTHMFQAPVVTRYLLINVYAYSEAGIGLKFDLIGRKAFELCRDPFGMEDERILDSQITASSNSQPARRNSGTVWTPSSDDVSQWIQVDLLELKTVTGVAIQKDLNDKNNALQEFSIAYSLDGNKWRNIRRPSDGALWTATLSSQTTLYDEWVEFPEALSTRFIRIRPIQWTGTPSLAFEIYGCGGGRYNELLGLGDSVSASGSGVDQATLDSDTAWAYSASAGSSVDLDISFNDPHLLLGIITQGHPTNSEWVLTYQIQYSLDGVIYRNMYEETANTLKVFNGNSDSNTKVRTIFPYPVLARNLRVQILTWSSSIGLRYSVVGTKVPMVGIETVGITEYPTESFHYSSGSFSSYIWEPLTDDPQPWIYVDLFFVTIVTGVKLLPVGSGGMVTEFQCSYSDDAFNWKFFADINDRPLNFTGLSDSNARLIMFSEEVLARFVRLHMGEWTSAPTLSFEVLGQQGKGQIRFTAHEAMEVPISIDAYNNINRLTLVDEVIYQEYITFYHLVQPAPFPIGNNLLVVIHTDLSTDPQFEGIFDGVALNQSVFSYNPTTHLGLVNVPSNLYSEIGDHDLIVTTENLISGPYESSVVIRVQYMVTDLNISVSEPYIKTDYEMSVYYDVERGSDMNCTIDMGDGNVYTRHEPVMLRGNHESTVPHTYRDPATYTITIECVNDVSNDSIDITVIVQNEVTLMSETHEELVEIICPDPGVLDVAYVFAGASNRKPTDAIAVYNFTGDSSFNITVDLVVVNVNEEFIQKLNISQWGSFEVHVSVHNLVSEFTFSFHLEIEEVINGLRIQPKIPHWKVDEPAVLDFLVDCGSRITYEITDFGDSFTHTINPQDNITITHSYSEPGFYRISVTATNAVSSSSYVMTTDVIIQHPVTNFLVGARYLNKLETELMYIEVPINLYRENSVPHPTDAFYTIDLGNSVYCQEGCTLDSGMENFQDSSLNSDTHTNIISFSQTYVVAKLYDVKYIVWNLVSNETYTKQIWIFEEITELEDYVKFNWVSLSGAAANNATFDQDFFAFVNKMYVPLERATVMTADFVTGTEITYVWDFGDFTKPAVESIVTTREPRGYYWYSKPGEYIVTLNASNPVHYQTVQSKIVVQASTTETYLVDRGPMPKNYTAYFDLQLGSVPTDACYYINYIDESSESHWIEFYGTRSVCEDEYKEDFNSIFLRFTSLDSLDIWEQKFERNDDPKTDIVLENKFMTTGGYNLKFIVHNYVSRKELNVFHVVTNAPCFTPEVNVSSENRCNTNYPCYQNTEYREYRASMKITVSSSIAIDCKSTKIANYTWTAYKQFNSRRGSYEEEYPLSPDLVKGGSRLLILEPTALEYGTYRFELNVSMFGEIGLWAIDSTTLVVVPSPLKIGIDGGEIRIIPWDQTITVDASLLTYDPDKSMDDQSGMRFIWMCRRKTYKPRNESIPRIENLETFQVWNSDYTTLEEESEINPEFDPKRDPEDVGGCFGRYNQEGSPSPGGILNFTTATMTFNTTGMYWDMLYEIILVVMKDTRRAEIMQELDVSEGDPPDMKITCKVNCNEKKNPTNRFSLEGRDRKWKRGVVYYYRWEIQHRRDNVFWFISTDEWLPKSGTGNNVANLCLDPGVFLELETYKIRLVASRNKDFSNAGLATSTFLTNERPTLGYCTVSPSSGIATDTPFMIKCFNYTDVDTPLSYQFSIRSNNATEWNIVHTGTSSEMAKTSPFGPGDPDKDYIRTIRVVVTDGIGSFRVDESMTVKVLSMPIAMMLNKVDVVINDIENYVSGGDTAGASNLISAAAGIINMDSNSTEGRTFSTSLMITEVVGLDLNNVGDQTSAEYNTLVDKVTAWFDEVLGSDELYLETEVQTFIASESIVLVGFIFTLESTHTTSSIATVLETTSQTGEISYNTGPFTVTARTSSETTAQLVELRRVMVDGLYELSKNIPSIGIMKQMSNAMYSVASKPDQLSQESKSKLIAAAENFAYAVDSISGGDVSAEEVEDAVKTVMSALGKSFAESKNDVASDEDASETESTDESDEVFGTESPLSASEQLKLENAEMGLYVMALLQNKVASMMVTGQNNVIIDSGDIASEVSKAFTESLSNATFGGAGGNKFGLPDIKAIVGDGNETTADVEIKSSSQSNNPFGGSTGGDGPKGALVSMDMKNDTGQQMVVRDIPEPIEISVCRSDKDLGATSDNSSNDIVWTYSETTMSGTPMQLSKLNNVAGNSALFLNIEAIGEEPAEDEDEEITWDVESYTLYVFVSFNEDPSESSHHVNCTLQQWLKPLNATKPPEYYDRPWNGTLYSEILGETRCYFSNLELESYLNGSGNTVNIGVRHVFGANLTEEEEDSEHAFSPLRYAISFYTSKCMYYDAESKQFKSDGCEVGSNSDRLCTQCFCTHLTSFGGGFSVPMNTIDLSESAFTKLGENPVVFVFMTVCICIYTVVIIWARKEDQRDKMRAGVTPMSDNDPRHRYNYELTFFTGVRKNSSTTANVSFILQGENGETGIRVVKDKKRKLFERGGIDSFLMAVPKSLGTMVHLRIWHDNKGKRPSWFLSRASIKDLQTNRIYYFMLDKWLAVEEDDGQIERIIPVAGMSELTSFGHLFYSRTRRNLSDAHLWFSVFMRPAKSTFNRCERATCCLSLLFCTMMANIFFYGQDVTGGAGSALKVGPIELSLGQIVVGVISSLMVVPANVIIVQLFRLSKPMMPNDRCCGCCCPKKRKNKYLAQGSRLSLVSSLSADLSKKKASMDGSDELKEQLDLLEAGSRMQSRAGTAKHGTTSRMSCVSNSGIDVMEAPEKSDVKEMKPVLGYKKTKKKKKDPNPLPWWFAIFGWILAWMTIGVAFWLTIEVAGGFGKEKATEWLTTIGISLVQDILVSQPIKVLMLATFFSLVIKSPDKEDDSQSPHLEKDEEWLHERLTEEELNDPSKLEEFQKQRDAEVANSLPPDEDEINEMREFRFKEMQMNAILREISIYLLFLYILMTVSFGNTDPTAFAFRETMLDSFVHASYHGKMPFSSVASRDYFWNYTQNVMIPSLFAGQLLNGELDEFGLKQALVADHTSSLVGIARMRQLRVIPDLCEIPEIMSKTVDSCRPAYGAFTEDDRYFYERWVLANQTHPPEYKGLMDVWRHQSWFDLGSLPYWGKTAVYGGGGYIAELGKTVEDAWAIADYLRNSKWVDQYTRAVFFEFSVYNPVINFYAVSYMIAEFLPQGGAVPYYHFQTLKLDRYFGPYSYIVLAAEAGMCVFTLWFAFKEFKLIKKEKKKYFKDLGNIVEFITLALSVTAFVTYMYRTFVAKKLMAERDEFPNKFLNFQYVGQWDQLFCWMIGLILFISTIKFMKLLRFNKRMLLLAHTIKTCWMELLLFFMMFSVIFASYACAGFMLFGNSMIDYYTMVTTLESLFATLLGNFNFDEMVGVNRVLGPIFFFSFTLTIVFVLMNMFITIINEAFSVAKEENEKLKNELEIVDFMVRRFKEVTGFAEKRVLKPKRRHRYVEGIEPIQLECDEMQQKLILMVDQLNEFIRKEKVEELGEEATKSAPRPIFIAN
ncbi:uncharacterized protein LOC117117519, partial [Anneissia japonica]|uniref:uncharacterized protein LOC117117519 n=1 Tax=Anneissia japonica TaxID=1529436 RepID=UPI00142586C4